MRRTTVSRSSDGVAGHCCSKSLYETRGQGCRLAVRKTARTRISGFSFTYTHFNGRQIISKPMSNWNLYFLVGDTSVGLIRAALFFRSKVLSEKYNAWTTRLRTRNSRINPPPTPRMAELNYKIMVTLFRLFGIFLCGGAVWAAYAFSVG